MKTLDEVITALTACTYTGNVDCEHCVYYDPSKDMDGENCDDYAIPQMQVDALQYLKLFQAHEQRVRGQLDDLKEEYRPNDPLTWQDLKQMEGKPVWIEPVKEWMLITEIEKDEGADRVWLLSLDGCDYDMGCHADWQAYRKERS